MDPKSRSFLGACASAIKEIALLIIKLVYVADNAVSMADKAVRAARERQAMELDLEQEQFEHKLEHRAALRTVKDEVELQKFVENDPERAKLMQNARANIKKIIAKSKANLAPINEDE